MKKIHDSFVYNMCMRGASANRKLTPVTSITHRSTRYSYILLVSGQAPLPIVPERWIASPYGVKRSCGVACHLADEETAPLLRLLTCAAIVPSRVDNSPGAHEYSSVRLLPFVVLCRALGGHYRGFENVTSDESMASSCVFFRRRVRRRYQ